jgi:hypothetical protein
LQRFFFCIIPPPPTLFFPYFYFWFHVRKWSFALFVLQNIFMQVLLCLQFSIAFCIFTQYNVIFFLLCLFLFFYYFCNVYCWWSIWEEVM